MARKSKIDGFVDLLGKVPDQQIAKLAGVEQPASVQSQRRKRKINSFRQNCNKINKALSRLSKKISDIEAAKELDVPVELLTVLRRKEDILKNPKKALENKDFHAEVVKAILEKETHKKPGRKAKKAGTTKTTSQKVSVKKTVKKTPTKKVVTKKSPKKKTKKVAAKKEVVKKVNVKKAAVKKAAVKKAAAKKVAEMKASANKESVEKVAEIKVSTKKVSTKKASTKKASAKKASAKKASAKKASAKKASAKKASAKKASANKESVKKASANKESVKKASAKKESAKKESVKKESTKKESAKKESKKEAVVFVQAYECSFVHGDETTSIYVTASSFLEASKKIETTKLGTSVKGILSSVRCLGIALR